MGLDVALPGSQQRLVVSAAAVPVTHVLPLIQAVSNPNPFPIVSVRRPQFYDRYKGYDGTRFIGDVLTPHNVRNISRQPLEPSECERNMVNRMATYINNHVYMEHSLQATYTAAAFYLFQNGMARDVVNQTMATDRTMLAFDGNTQAVDVYVYIPKLNVVLTLVGCGLLVVLVAVVVLWSLVVGGADPLAHITEPHAIASVLLNEAAFTPLLLRRSVDAPGKGAGNTDNADEFCIDSLSLQHKEAVVGDTASGANNNTSHETSGPSRPPFQIDP